MKGNALISSPWYSVIEHMAMVESCAREGLDWTLRSIGLLRGWSCTGSGSLERWLLPQACQHLRIWTMPLLTSSDPWLGLSWPGN